jgi:hypothetical protein
VKGVWGKSTNYSEKALVETQKAQGIAFFCDSLKAQRKLRLLYVWAILVYKWQRFIEALEYDKLDN